MTEKLKYKRVLGDWVLGKTLGQGSMGKVKLAFNSKSKEKLACKIIHRPSDAPDLPKGVTMIGPTDELKDLAISGQIKKLEIVKKDVVDNGRLLREVGVSLLLDHENIVKLKFIYMDAENYYLFFQYVDGGQLLDFIISHGMLNEKLSRKFLRQIISAVDYCHSNSIVHRDLKIENILIDKKGTLKLIDFGLANFIDPYKNLATFCGSLYFAAPEVLSAKKYVGPEVDMWSIGVILYVLVTGKVPFDDSTLPGLHRKIKAGIYDHPIAVTSECLDLISKLLVVDPRKRASMEDVKRHPWVTKVYQDVPGNDYIIHSNVKLPLNQKIIKRMCGLGFGNPSEISQALETYLRDGRSQGCQKWSVGGRSITCPESPLLSIYNLTCNKYEKAKLQQSENTTLSRRKSRQRSSTLENTDVQRKSLWNIFRKHPTGSDDTINIQDGSNTERKENSELKSPTSNFISKLIFSRSKDSKNDTAVHISADSKESDTINASVKPRMDTSAVTESEDKRRLERKHSKKSTDHSDLPRASIDVSRSVSESFNTSKVSSKSLDLRRDSDNQLKGSSSLFRFTKIRSKTQMNLKDSDAKSGRASRLVSPSMAAIKSFSSKIFSRKEENAPTQNITGAATLDIKTSYLSGIFTIRNTTSLPVVEIRKELVKAFSRVPNLEIIEQRGYFYCKFFDNAPEKATEQKTYFRSPGRQERNNKVNSIRTREDSCDTLTSNGEKSSKSKAQFEVFIRKIPFSSMHGIQFNKISGDAYKYKKVCAQILSMASL